MIETIYSNESGDAGKSNKVQNSFKMPKNIRQIGKSNATKKVYVEDYVMTYIKQLAGGDYSGLKIAVLVGQCIRLENCRNIFVSGALEVKDLDTTGEITFSNDTWTGIYEDIKKFFTDAEIVGWFLGGPGYLLVDEEKIQKIHVDNFAGQDKVLLTYDNMEREEAFYSYENNKLCRQEGYYIYYEKNEEMQTYMIDNKKGQSNEVTFDDRVSREIRSVLQHKKPTEEESKSITRLMYAAGTLLAVIILVVGAAILSNYDQMKSMQNTLNYLTRNMEDIQTLFAEGDYTEKAAGEDDEESSSDMADSEKATEEAGTEDADTASDSGGQSLDIEVVPGDVEPIEETDGMEDNQDDEDNNENPASGEDLAEDNTAASEDVEQTAEEEPEDTEVSQVEVKYYIVVSGDTLADISYKLYNTYTKAKTIMELNQIENQDFIYVGQKLIVP